MYYSDYNRMDEGQNVIETSFYTGGPTEPPKKKKKRWPKTVALCLACALVGGAAGGAGVALAGGAFSQNETTIYEADRTPVAVTVVNTTDEKALTIPQIYATNVGSSVGITVDIVTTNIFGQTVSSPAAGSGFVITKDGYIMTNYHVIDGASNIKVSFVDGTSYDAKLVGGERENDVAVLKIDAQDLTPVKIGNSDDMRVGEQVVAIGNPLGELTYTLTAGYVSALDRNITMQDGTVMNMLQTDAAINSGNSGGPLFNVYGQVIGITSAKLSGNSGSSASIEGLGFAIPINDVIDMAKDIMEHGYVTGKPYMGLLVGTVSAEAQQYGTPAGAYVTGVVPESSAALAGLEKGDIIIAIDKTEIATSTQLISAKKDYRAGDTATLKVIREGQAKLIELTFQEQTAERTTQQEEYRAQLEEAQRQEQQAQYDDQMGGFTWPFRF